MDREGIELAAKGAFIYGAVFFLGLFLSGDKFAMTCALAGCAASYVAQVSEAFRCAGLRWAAVPLFIFWAIALICGAVGAYSVVGG
jgi:hypothetical protein